MTILVTGARGHVGRAVLDALVAAGQDVRASSRDATTLDVPTPKVSADLEDPSTLDAALDGVESVFLYTRPSGIEGFVKAAEAAGVRHVVLLSSVGAQHPTGTGPVVSLHNAEEQLRASGLPATFVRASYFVENWGAVLQTVRGEGVLPSFIPAHLILPSVSTPDIGRTVAQSLVDGPQGLRVIELSGPSDVTPSDVAAIFAHILERPIKVVEAPLDAVVPTFTSFGFSENVAGLYRDMYEAIVDGRLRAEPGGEHLRGTTPIEPTLRGLIA